MMFWGGVYSSAQGVVSSRFQFPGSASLKSFFPIAGTLVAPFASSSNSTDLTCGVPLRLVQQVGCMAMQYPYPLCRGRAATIVSSLRDRGIVVVSGGGHAFKPINPTTMLMDSAIQPSDGTLSGITFYGPQWHMYAREAQ